MKKIFFILGLTFFSVWMYFVIPKARITLSEPTQSSIDTAPKEYKQLTYIDLKTGSRLVLSLNKCSSDHIVNGQEATLRNSNSSVFESRYYSPTGEINQGCWWMQGEGAVVQNVSGGILEYPLSIFTAEYN